MVVTDEILLHSTDSGVIVVDASAKIAVLVVLVLLGGSMNGYINDTPSDDHCTYTSG
jgi:hypothetical protein